MKIKTSELYGHELNWAVAQCKGLEIYIDDGIVCLIGQPFDKKYAFWTPSTDWEQAGPIIEREMISLEWTGEDWMAYIWHDREYFGSTPLLAAMRCYVDHVIGDEVEVPHELVA